MKATSVKRLSALPVKNGLGLSGSESDRSNPRYIRITDIDQGGQLREDIYASQPRSVIEDAWVESGDVLIASVGATVGKSYLHKADGEYCFAGYLSRIRPDPEKLDPRFLHYWTQSKDYWDQVRTRLVSSTIENLSASKIGTFEVPTPPLPLQNKIADYLDHETAEIDAFIADLELAWHLTNSRFDGRLATTFAEVPDWVSLRRLATLSTGSTPSSSWGEDAFHPDGLDWIGPGDINESERITRGSKKLSQLVSSEVRVHRTPAILVVGIGATVGRVGQTEGPFATNQQITAVTPKSVDTKYLYFALRSLSTYIRKTAHGNTLPIVNNSQLGALKVPLVSSTDQVRLACELDIEMSRTKEVGNEIRQAVDLARERRTALISAVVTGQIDVTQRHRPIAKELKDEVLQKT